MDHRTPLSRFMTKRLAAGALVRARATQSPGLRPRMCSGTVGEPQERLLRGVV